jgi:sigma-B regulation protein RsbU (phosphoserine phosphatase)
MKIKTLLIISYLTIIIGLSGGFYFFFRVVNRELTNKNIKATAKGVHEIVVNNFNLSTKVLTKIGEHIVSIKAQEAAYRLAYLLKDIPRPFDYEALRTNAELRAAATTPVYSYGGESGYIDVYDTNGLSIWHPNKRIQGKNYKQWKNKYPAMWKITKESFTKSFATGYYTFVSKKGAKKRRKFMAAVHITNTPFVACASVYINDYFLPVQEIISKGEIDVCSNVFDEIYNAAEQNEERTRIIGGIVLVILSIAGVFAGLWFSGTISSPIRALSNAVQKIAGGDFSTKVKEKGPPEIVQLASSFNSLGDELVVYMDDLKKEVAVRETYQREMDIARDIQQSLLPRVFPPFPERNEFSLYAGVQPAKEVAGDFFDFFFAGEDILTLIVGDVSGKSVPAAMFMAVSRTLLRTVCSHEKDLAEAINYANNILCEDNDTCMFVTLFVANLNVKTGEIIYCNAGHHEACVLKANGKVDLFGVHGSPALGIVPDVQYKTGRYTLAAGDKIVLYTDGVTEAHSPEKELFGEERLFEILKREPDNSPEELYGKVIERLNDFQDGEIFDDITLLILERC